MIDVNHCMYDNYEERIEDMSNNVHKAIYMWDAQQNKVKEYQQQIEADKIVVESLREQLSKLQEELATI